MSAWLPQASYPCGNFSDTSSLKFSRHKGSIGHAFTVCIRTENPNQMSFYPFVLHEISVLIELILGHLRYLLTDVPPQPNSPPDYVFDLDTREQRSRQRWFPEEDGDGSAQSKKGGGRRGSDKRGGYETKDCSPNHNRSFSNSLLDPILIPLRSPASPLARPLPRRALPP